MGGLLTWREFEVSQVGTWAWAVQPLQVTRSILFPRAAFVMLACYFSGNHSCLAGYSFSAPYPSLCHEVWAARKDIFFALLW